MNALSPSPITALFLDIGGVLLSNGWDHNMRRHAADVYKLDYEELNERHHLTFDTYEEGKLSLDEYLRRVIFYTERPFTLDNFKQFMFAQSHSYPEMIRLIQSVKKNHHLKVAAVSNEGRELTEYRIRQFQLNNFIDFFIASSFVHIRKPDADIYRIALDIAQVPPEQVAYVEDRPMFVDVAASLGIHGLRHVDYQSTGAAFRQLGLTA
ncbi:MAG: HAD-IA family hydrolase [Ardenticatenaceae bacterium]|nr:HAD-IA family hydrolase [Anaerolineales bacterium]MCB8986030.1 HAD-IA family hydrolase [Ardenticatenaceae bacterium]